MVALLENEKNENRNFSIFKFSGGKINATLFVAFRIVSKLKTRKKNGR